MNRHQILAVLLPFLALALQWLLWPWIDPFVWFLFFPAVFFSARLGGLWCGLVSTVLSTGIVWFFFIPPQLSWAMNNPSKLYSVGLFLIMGYLFSDTHERLRRAQQYSVAKLKEAQQLAKIGSWDWNIRTDVHTWSDETYRIYDRDPALPAADYSEVQNYFTQESWTRLAAAVEQSLAAGIAYECDAEMLRPDGSHRWIVARGAATRDADGTVIGLHGTVQDITERKRAEQEILRLNADLEKRVAERTSELTAANRELDSFAYAVSHELRAPLRAMSGFSQALIEDYGERFQDDARAYLDQIGLASRRMSDLIDGLLALSRSTHGGVLQHDVLDISELSEHLLAELAHSDPRRQVAVQVQTGLQARGDVRMIESVLRNLLGNAWKYTAQTVAPCIRVYTEERGGAPRFCVADNGAGFDMAYVDKLFQPFQRLHRQDEFPGIGIGLATVQRIIHRHGGVIDAQGVPGKGAIFCFTLSGMSENKEV